MIHIDRVNNFVFPTRFPTTTLYYKQEKKKKDKRRDLEQVQKKILWKIYSLTALYLLCNLKEAEILFYGNEEQGRKMVSVTGLHDML